MRPPPKPRIAPRLKRAGMSPEKLRTLGELARCEAGTAAVPGLMDGGVLAALVQLGFAERIASDRMGGCRYRINEAGRDLLVGRGASGARKAANDG